MSAGAPLKKQICAGGRRDVNNKQQINKTKIIVNDTSCGGDLAAQFSRLPSPSRLDVARRSRKRSWRFLGGPGARDDKICLRRLAGGTAANRAREPRRRIARDRGRLAGLASSPTWHQIGLFDCGK